MYYVLALRKLDDPDGRVHAIARSDSEQGLWTYVEQCSVIPTYREIGGKRVLCVYGQDTELAEYAPPNPQNNDEGVLYFGSIEERVTMILNTMRPDIERQVRESRAEIERNTIIV